MIVNPTKSFEEELRIYETVIAPQLYKEIQLIDAAESLLNFRVGESGGSSNSVILYGNTPIASLKLRGKKHYITIERSLSKEVPSQFVLEKSAATPNTIRILLNENGEIESLIPIICIALRNKLANYSKTFDCCSRFESCSESRRCVHPDKVHAMECGYRKILLSGKVFFGKSSQTE